MKTAEKFLEEKYPLLIRPAGLKANIIQAMEEYAELYHDTCSKVENLNKESEPKNCYCRKKLATCDGQCWPGDRRP